MRGPAKVDTRDDGFTLIEVVVALMLLGIVAAGALLFFMNTMQSTSHLQRTQAAATIATQGMERVRAVDPRPAAGAVMSPLLAGRSQAAVQAAWDAADPSDIAETMFEYDPNPVGPAAIPVTDTSRVSDMNFTITTHVGSCYRPKAASWSQDECVTSGVSAPPPASMVRMYRVVVVVSWAPGGNERCQSGVCTYTLSTLVDVSDDAEWNISEGLFAYASEATYTIGDEKEQFFLPPALEGIPLTKNPTTITQGPTPSGTSGLGRGTAAVNTTNPGMGAIRYQVPKDYSGPVTVMYTLNDGFNPVTAPVPLNITILPKPYNDAGHTVAVGTSTLIPVLANDKPSSGLTIVSEDFKPVVGPGGNVGDVTASVESGQLKVTAKPGIAPQTVTFTYRVQDAKSSTHPTQGISETTATVSVTVFQPVSTATTFADVVFPVMAATKTSTGARVPLDFAYQNGATTVRPAAGETVRIEPIAGQLTLVDNNGTVLTEGSGTDFRFQRASNFVGIKTFKFRIVDANKVPSTDLYTGTLITAPLAVNPTSATPTSRNTQTVSVTPSKTNNVPAAATAGFTYQAGSTTCAAVTVSDPNNGVFSVERNRQGGRYVACSFQYRIVMTVGGVEYPSSYATVQVNVS